MPEIKINRLNIRLKGISPAEVRKGSEGLSQMILKQVQKEPKAFSMAEEFLYIDTLDLDAIHISSNTRTSEWRDAAASRIAEAIKNKIQSRSNPKNKK